MSSSLVNFSFYIYLKRFAVLCCYWTLYLVVTTTVELDHLWRLCVTWTPHHLLSYSSSITSSELNIKKKLKLDPRYKEIYCCSNHSPERHLWYAYFSKAHRRLSSSGDYKRTWQGALAVLILYIYYRLLVYATTIITCPYIYISSSCPITHLHVFSLRLPCFLYMPWYHTLNLCYTCTYYVYTMRNSCPLTLLLTVKIIDSGLRLFLFSLFHFIFLYLLISNFYF